jgi:hypothetical protein
MHERVVVGDSGHGFRANEPLHPWTEAGVAQLLGTRAVTFKAMKATQVQEVKR